MNELDNLYEYSQPVTISGTTIAAQAINNPFGVDAECCVLAYFCGDTAGSTILSYDNAQPASPLNTFPNGMNGIHFQGQSTGVYIDYWVPIKDNVYVVSNMPTGKFSLTMGFRRLKEVGVPYDHQKYFSNPSE